jgi:hypothetical protein
MRAELHDGTILEFPDGTDPAVIQRTVKTYLSGGADQQKAPDWDAGKSLAQGVTFGFLDEAKGALRAMKDVKKDGVLQAVGDAVKGTPKYEAAYKARVAEVRDAEKQYAEQNPGTAIAANVAGGLLVPVPGATAVMGAKSLSAVPTFAKAAGLGGALGAIGGAGNAEEGGRLSGAAQGAGIGAGLGAALSPIAGLVGKGYDAAFNSLSQRVKGLTKADRKIAGIVQEIGGGDMNAGLTEVSRRLADAGHDAAIIDVLGIGGEKLGRAAANVPGKSASIADNFVTARTLGRGGRLQGASDNLAPRENIVEKIDTLAAAREAEANKLYGEAFKANQDVMTPEIDAILSTPAGSAALKDAARLMQNDRSLLSKADPELTAALKEAADLGKADYVPGGVARGFKMRTLDYVKRALGDMEGRAIRDGKKTEASFIGDLRRGLVKELDAADVTGRAGPNSLKPEGGLYAQGRAKFAEKTKVMNALEDGTKFINGDVELTAKQLSKLSDGEKEAFRLGARKAIGQMIDRDTQTAVTRLDPKKAGIWEKLKTVFPDTEYSAFKKEVDNEINKLRVERFAGPRSGSQTAGLGSDIADMANDVKPFAVAGRQLLQGSPLQAAGTAAGGVIERLSAPNPRVAEDLARRLFAMDPASRNAALQALSRASNKPNAGPMIQGLLAGSSGMVGGRVGGLLSAE